MKLTKKKILAIALAISMMAIISAGSLAWFNAQDTVTNTFMIATSTDTTADDVFSIDAYEYIDGTTTKEQTGHSYTDVLPGDTLKKEAHAANTGYYDQYVRVIVTLSDGAAWRALLPTTTTATSDVRLLACFNGLDTTKWTVDTIEDDATADTIKIVLYYNGIMDGDDTANDGASEVTDEIVFTDVIIPNTMTQADAITFGTDGFTIGVVAQAVQTENVGVGTLVGAAAAKAAFTTVGMTY